jgi:Cdc6-like AAA superfamily ATPase
MTEKFYNCLLQKPSRFIIYGPSGSGKSTFVKKMLFESENLFDCLFNKIIYCTATHPGYENVKGIQIDFHENITEDLLDNIDSNSNNCIILDDIMRKVTNDILISDLFTRISHHKNITVLLLVQNLFPKSKYMRDIALNSNYIVLMRNPCDIRQIQILSNQIEGNSKNSRLVQAYKNATRDAFSYLFLDLCQNTPEEIKYRTKIFLSDGNSICYLKN